MLRGSHVIYDWVSATIPQDLRWRNSFGNKLLRLIVLDLRINLISSLQYMLLFGSCRSVYQNAHSNFGWFCSSMLGFQGTATRRELNVRWHLLLLYDSGFTTTAANGGAFENRQEMSAGEMQTWKILWGLPCGSNKTWIGFILVCSV